MAISMGSSDDSKLADMDSSAKSWGIGSWGTVQPAQPQFSVPPQLVERFEAVTQFCLPGLVGGSATNGSGPILELWYHPGRPTGAYETRYWVTVGNERRMVRAFGGWPLWIELRDQPESGPPLTVQGGRAIEIEDEEDAVRAMGGTLGPIEPQREREVVPIGTGETAAPSAARFQPLPPETQLTILSTISEVLTGTKEIEVYGQPVSVKALRNAATFARIQVRRFGWPPRFAESDLQAQIRDTLKQLGEEATRK